MQPELKEELNENKLYLETPLLYNMKDERPKDFLNSMRGT